MIRPATLEDLQTLVDMGHAMTTESPRFRGYFSGPRLRASCEQLIQGPQGFVRVAEVDGEIVGVVLAMASEHWCMSGLYAQELCLYVVPARRGGLTATRLITHMVAWAKAMQCRKLIAGTSAGISDAMAVALYERLGFTRCSTGLEIAYVHGG